MGFIVRTRPLARQLKGDDFLAILRRGTVMAKTLMHALLLVVLFPFVGMAQAPNQAFLERIIPAHDPKTENFDILSIGSYYNDTVYKQDVFSVYSRRGAQTDVDRRTMDLVSENLNDADCNPATPGPVPGVFECNDRLLMAWKHFTCSNPDWACSNNRHWNVYYPDNVKNYSSVPQEQPRNVNYFRWEDSDGIPNNQAGTEAPPPVRSMANWFSTPKFVAPKCQPLATACAPPNTCTYSGAGAPTVIYLRDKPSPGQNTWYMAYDANTIWNSDAGSTDVHRIAWATSTDGVNWAYFGALCGMSARTRPALADFSSQTCISKTTISTC